MAEQASSRTLWRHLGANRVYLVGRKGVPEATYLQLRQGHKGRQGRVQGQEMVQGCRPGIQDSP